MDFFVGRNHEGPRAVPRRFVQSAWVLYVTGHIARDEAGDGLTVVTGGEVSDDIDVRWRN